MCDEGLQRGPEAGGRGQDEEDVPVDVLCEELVGGCVRGEDYPSNDACDREGLEARGMHRIEELGDVGGRCEGEEVDSADGHLGRRLSVIYGRMDVLINRYYCNMGMEDLDPSL